MTEQATKTEGAAGGLSYRTRFKIGLVKWAAITGAAFWIMATDAGRAAEGWSTGSVLFLLGLSVVAFVCTLPGGGSDKLEERPVRRRSRSESLWEDDPLTDPSYACLTSNIHHDDRH